MSDPGVKKRHRPLSDRGWRFVAEYLKDGNATQAAIRAGFSPNEGSAATQAGKLLKHPEVAEYLQRFRASLRENVAQRVDLAAERTLQTMADLAYFDVRRMFNEDGSVKPIHELGDAEAAAIAGFEVTVTGEGAKRSVTTKVRLSSRATAIDMAAKVAGAYKADNEQRRAAREMTDEELLARAMTLMGMKAPEGTTVQ